MNAPLRIQGGRVIDPASGHDAVADLFVSEGRIAALGACPDGLVVEREIDARGLVVCPGLVDLGARLREPGLEYKATIASETRAAAHGGITTICLPPDTEPPIETPADVELIRQRAEQAGYARVLPIGALSRALEGREINEMAALHAAGCVAMSNAQYPMASTLALSRALEYAATFDLVVFIHPSDPSLANRGCAHEGPVATRLGLPAIPEAAETVALALALELVHRSGVRAHFCRLSSRRAVDMIQRARTEGLAVSADVSAHQLHLTEIDLGDFDPLCHVLPPLRSQRDRDVLRDGVLNGSLTAICSDHQPHEEDAKMAPFPATAPGISALETLLPLALRLHEEQGMPLPGLLHRLTTGPADILGLDVGRLTPGSPADLCLFDPERWWTPRPETLASRGHNSPFLGWELKGKVAHTLLGGHTVYREPSP